MKHVKIGCYSGFWGDSADAVTQFLDAADPQLDYLVADYLAELTMGLLARASRSGKSSTAKGYIAEFVDLVIVPHMDRIIDKGIKIVTNAGGLDPVGLKVAIEAHLERRGLSRAVKVAAVSGDDLSTSQNKVFQQGSQAFDPLNGSGPKDPMSDGKSELLSLNAYLGGEPITRALQKGANIVVTGRVVDSALVLGPLAHEFQWDYSFDPKTLDGMASASLAGHVIECGAQCTGGNFTDWKTSAFTPNGGWANMGYPIATFFEDNSFTISKPNNTGGVVNRLSVCEQMLYEVLDTGNYLLPDVTLDLRQVQVEDVRPNVVLIRGAKGKPPSPWLKCTSVEQAGFRISVDFMVCGEEAEDKAEALGHAILDRTNALAKRRFKDKYPPIAKHDSEVMLIGAERSIYPSRQGPQRREVALRVAATHPNRAVLDVLGKEAAPLLTGSCPGLYMLTSGRPKASPNFSTTSVLVKRQSVSPIVTVGSTPSEQFSVPLTVQGTKALEASPPGISSISQSLAHTRSESASTRSLRTKLHDIAVARSGDKGDSSNIAIIAREAAFYPYIKEQVTSEVIYAALSHFIGEGGSVTRFEVPGVHAVNFVVTKSLGGGGLSSLRLDRQGKSYAQIALSAIMVYIPITTTLAARL